jgi:hypothetical protein
MRTVGIAVRRTVTVLLAGTILVAAAGTSASAAEKDGKAKDDKRTTSKASRGANSGCGEYCSTRDGSPSRNGNGGGKATGRPCAGCVGKADDKNPPGQRPNGSDSNNGYECDGNNGIGKSNPAHTGCTATAPAPQVAPTVVTPRVDPPKAAPKPAVTTVTPATVLGTRFDAPTARAAELPETVTVGAYGVAGPQVLGARLTRPAGSTNGPGTLPFTGGSTIELLLAAVALLVAGVAAMRAATGRQHA